MSRAGEIRTPVVAGSFYPASERALAVAVDALLDETDTPAPAGSALRGVIAPHAGYRYSGPIAATAYRCLSTVERTPVRIVVAGPSHFEPLRGLAVSGATAWRTPLGDVAIDERGREALVSAGARVDEAAHRSEHSIEVQLPFIQRCLPDVPVLPVAVGRSLPDEAAAALEAILTEEALLVVSTDLSHYHDAVTARRLDARTAAAVVALDLDGLHADDACGVDPLRAAVAWARRRGHRIELLDLRDSADTAGDPARVVGYGAFAIVAG